MLKVLTVVGARPQFVKAAPLSLALRARCEEILVHTGQHYDASMSDVFFEELQLPAPDHHLGIGGGPHGAQTGAMLAGLERVIGDVRPDAVLVYGDTNSTLAGALAAAKMRIPIAHVEAGLRSFNRDMPEEINRVLTDHLSTLLFVPSDTAVRQLAREGITAGVHVVGDIMYDAVRMHRAHAMATSLYPAHLGLRPDGYYVATLHRAENVDDLTRLTSLVHALSSLDRPPVLPVHPRTRERLRAFKIDLPGGIRPIDPLGYVDMLALLAHSSAVLTDSGGVQKEAYYLEVPCVTLREETEWVETIDVGWNVLAGSDRARISAAVASAAHMRRASHPELYGDGSAASRIADLVVGTFAGVVTGREISTP